MGFLDALFGVCIGALLVWYMMRRFGAGSAPASTTAEIERLRAVVEELTATLETKADAAEQRLTKLISEAQAVQNVLDRTLTTVGTQMVRPEPKTEAPTPAEAEPRPPDVLSTAIPSTVAPEPIGPRERIEVTSTSADLLAVARQTIDAPTVSDKHLDSIEAEVKPSVDTVDSEVNLSVDKGDLPQPVESVVAEPTKRDAGETAELEAKVMSLVARGVTNSVDLARQTGLTRGEVELILTLHNMHIAPSNGTWAEPAPQAVAAIAARSTDTKPSKSPDDVVVDPNDRYAAIYELIAAGVTDSVEIARRTGLGRGEVELHMGLHARRVL